MRSNQGAMLCSERFFDGVLVGPVLQCGGWRAEARRPIHQGRAADGAALQNGDGAVLAGPSDRLLVERGVGGGFLHVEVLAAAQRAFFDQQHLVTGRAEELGAGGTTGPAANDGDVGVERDVLLELRTVMGFPAAGDTFGKGVGDRHFGSSGRASGLRVHR
jgi:hypothetical protein